MDAPCPICKGKKKVKDKNNPSIIKICPHCKGKGKIVGPD